MRALMDVESTRRTAPGERPLTVLLPYSLPFDWEAVLAVFRAHQLPHLETVDDVAYERIITTKHGTGWFRVEHDAERHSIRLSVWNGSEKELATSAEGVRRMFDLDADPVAIGQAMKANQRLCEIWTRYPGLRVARSWNGFESMVTTILGQLVSVSFGRTLTDELMQSAGVKSRHPKTGQPIHLFPTAKSLLTANLSTVRTSEGRRIAIRSLAKLVCDGTLRWKHPLPPKELRKTLLSVPGVGAWTSEYIAMRGFRDDDAFPATDYGLKQELKRYPDVDVNDVRPWRAYAATALWRSFAAAKGAAYESVV
jgi:DNA-3-methyladenine glycosylase II